MPAKKKTAAKKGLTAAQKKQRVYAAKMKGIRARAAKAAGGKGKIKKRGAATKLRRSLGLKKGK